MKNTLLCSIFLCSFFESSMAENTSAKGDHLTASKSFRTYRSSASPNPENDTVLVFEADLCGDESPEMILSYKKDVYAKGLRVHHVFKNNEGKWEPIIKVSKPLNSGIDAKFSIDMNIKTTFLVKSENSNKTVILSYNSDYTECAIIKLNKVTNKLEVLNMPLTQFLLEIDKPCSVESLKVFEQS